MKDINKYKNLLSLNKINFAFKSIIINKFNKKNYSFYPSVIGIETSTFCNINCNFCTYNNLININKIRKKMFMNKTVFKKIINKLNNNILFNMDNLQIGLHGLGEPLMNKNIFYMINYTKKIFPNSFLYINTNGHLLNRKLIDCDLDKIFISLNYLDKEDYEKQCNSSFDNLIDKIIDFMDSRYNGFPIVEIRIMNSVENRFKMINYFNLFKKHLKNNDILGLTKPLDLVNWDKNNILKSCVLPFFQLYIDVDGFMFPCCYGIGIPFNICKNYPPVSLCLGNILDDKINYLSLLELVNIFRYKQLNGFIDLCKSCPYLFKK